LSCLCCISNLFVHLVQGLSRRPSRHIILQGLAQFIPSFDESWASSIEEVGEK
jgi:hypothetical protein